MPTVTSNAMKEAGEILVPIEEGVFTKDDIVAELTEMCAGTATLRESDDEITLFKSVGNGDERPCRRRARLQNLSEVII